MVEVEEVYNKKGAELSEVVRPIKEVNRKHQQVMCNTVMCVCVEIDKLLHFVSVEDDKCPHSQYL